MNKSLLEAFRKIETWVTYRVHGDAAAIAQLLTALHCEITQFRQIVPGPEAVIAISGRLEAIHNGLLAALDAVPAVAVPEPATEPIAAPEPAAPIAEAEAAVEAPAIDAEPAESAAPEAEVQAPAIEASAPEIAVGAADPNAVQSAGA